MGKAKSISLKLQEQIVKAVKKGSSYQAVSEVFGVSKSGVGHVMERFKQRECVEIRKSGGRPLVTTKREDDALVRLSKSQPRLDAVQLHAQMVKNYGLKYSVSTVKRRLNNAGLFGRRPCKKPLISAKNRKARVEFAKAHKNWTAADWSKVLWSDESKYLLFGTDGIKYVRRPLNTRFNPQYQLPTVKHGGGSIMVWGCFSRDGVGPIHRIEGIMEQVMYKNIISDIMLPHARRFMGRGWLFQQDNDPKHTAKSVKEFFNKKKIRVLEWPSQSPDLNPIEHLWDHLNRQIAGQKPSNKNDLFTMLKEAWDNIELNVLIKLVDSMPARCQKVIDAKGYATSY
jgi:transposase